MNGFTIKKPNLFWKILSYFADLPIDHLSSEFNPNIGLYLSRGQFKLVSDNAIYSFGMQYRHFVAAFRKIKVHIRKPKNILVLGLGTGSIPQMLQSQFNITADFDFVELDPEIVFLFEKYLDFIYTGPYKIYCKDGLDFLESNSKQYDLICMDIFEDSTIPIKFESEKFLSFLNSALASSGILLYNRLHATPEDQELNKKFLETFSKVFPKYQVINHEYNWILVSEKNQASFNA
ncbi:MAG: fused MFS/spermidine synthase [Saprospiraceae bacterium]|nr:fused MFS/spermidine synthase [Saprospiraceae bacterium]